MPGRKVYSFGRRCVLEPPEEITLTIDDAGSLAPPTAIGPYRVLHQVGAGVLGPVYRAHSADDNREVAVKLFKLDLTPEQAQELAAGLARLCERVPAHPHIPACIGAGLAGSTPWLAQEYVPADALDARLRRRTGGGLKISLPVLRQIAAAIDAAADRGLHHGALHPRDVLISTTGEVRVTGFGVADAVAAAGGPAVARRPYAAPERSGTTQRPADAAADVFSLGTIAVEMLTGRRPIGTGATAVGFVSGVAEGIDADACRRALARALADAPRERFATATAFVAALARAAEAGVEERAPGESRAPGPEGPGLQGPEGPGLQGPEGPGLQGREGPGLQGREGPGLHKKEGPRRHEPVTLAAPIEEPVAPTAKVEAPAAPVERPAAPPRVRHQPPHRAAAVKAPEPPPVPAATVVVPAAPIEPPVAPLAAVGPSDTPAAPVEEPAAPARPRHQTPHRAPAAKPPDPHPEAAAPVVSPTPLRHESPVEDVAEKSRREPALAAIEIDTPNLSHAVIDVVPPSSLEVDFPISEASTAPAPLAKAPAVAEAPRIDVAGEPPGQRDAVEDRPDEPGGGLETPRLPRLWPSAALLLIGVGVGLLAGYLLWGRSSSSPASPPATVARSSATPSTTTDPARPSPAPAPQAAGPTIAPPQPLVGSTDREKSAAASAAAAAVPKPTSRGRVFVRSRPPGARVSVDGRARGDTPITIDDLPLGAHELTLSRQGYQPVTRRVQLKTSRTVSVTVTLKRRAAEPASRAQADAKGQAQAAAAGPDAAARPTLEVASRPSGARVFIDGAPVGTTPLTTTSIAPGPHTVQLELAGHRPWTTTVTLERGRRTRVAGSLELVP